MNNLLGQTKIGSKQALIIKVSILTLGLLLSLFLVEPIQKAVAATGIDCRGNSLPEAKFSPLSPSINLGETVVFDGSESSDADGHALEYLWTVRGYSLQGTDSVFSFTPTESGSYFIKLKVTDECGGPGIYFTNVIVKDGNSVDRCFANAKPQAVLEPVNPVIGLSESVTFSADNSFDAEKDNLSFQWLVDGVLLSNEATFTFIPTSLGDFVVALKAQDQCGESEVQTSLTVASDTGSGGVVTNEASGTSGSSGSSGGYCTGSAPTAVAGDDISVLPGEKFVLDGTASVDPEGDILNYLWRIKSIGFTAKSATTSLAIQDPGTYEAELVVSDACSSHTDVVAVSVGLEGSDAASTAGPAEPGTAAPDKSSQAQQQVLGEEIEFIPPAISPRAGSGIPIKEIGLGILSGWLFGLSIYYFYRRRII